jgi:hypothetical protein
LVFLSGSSISPPPQKKKKKKKEDGEHIDYRLLYIKRRFALKELYMPPPNLCI